MLNNNNSLQQIKDIKQQVDSPFLVHQFTRQIHRIMQLCYHPNEDIINTTIYIKKNIFHKSKVFSETNGSGLYQPNIAKYYCCEQEIP